MRELVKERLPPFSSPDEVKGTYDFVGLNYYTAYYAANANTSDPDHLRYQTDSNANITGKNFVILVLLRDKWLLLPWTEAIKIARLCPEGLKQCTSFKSLKLDFFVMSMYIVIWVFDDYPKKKSP